LKEKHIVTGLLFLSCAAIVVLLCNTGFNSATKELTAKEQTAKFEADFFSIIAKAKENLSDFEQAVVTEKDQMAGEEDTIIAFPASKFLINFWDSLQRFDISGFYYKTLYNKTGSEFYLMNASQRFFEQARVVADSSAKIFYLQESKQGFNKVLEMNPKNLDAKVGKALCIVEDRSKVMQGVPLLKEVIAEDSTNLLAWYSLGMLQIESGQLQKALVSFEKLVSLQPFNGELYFYLADVQQKMGNSTQAILNYEKAKMLTNDKDTKQAIDDILRGIK
jgi:tetratricopeptide (TPR) repeat protein